MNTQRTKLLAFVVLIAAVMPCHSQVPADRSPAAIKEREHQSALKAGIKSYESWLARNEKLHQLGAISEYELSIGRQNLAMLRYDLALANDDSEAACEQTRALVRWRESDFQRLVKLQTGGAAPAAFVEIARRRLAAARYLLALDEQEFDDIVPQLETIVDVSAAELRRAQNAAKVGVVSPAEIGLIRGRMAFANYLLANENGNADEAFQNLRIAITERENAMNRIDKLVRVGAASKALLAESRHSWLRARVQLAIEEDKRDAVRDLHLKLVETSQELFNYLKSNPQTTTPEQLAVSKAVLVDYELRLAQSADAATPLRMLLRRPLVELDN